jgi:ABC-type uncharacterized transport system permease subunit
MSKKTTEDQLLLNKNAGWHTIFSILSIVIFVGLALLVWHSHWDKNHACGIMAIIAAIISLVPFGIYLKQHLQNKKITNQN